MWCVCKQNSSMHFQLWPHLFPEVVSASQKRDHISLFRSWWFLSHLLTHNTNAIGYSSSLTKTLCTTQSDNGLCEIQYVMNICQLSNPNASMWSQRNPSCLDKIYRCQACVISCAALKLTNTTSSFDVPLALTKGPSIMAMFTRHNILLHVQVKCCKFGAFLELFFFFHILASSNKFRHNIGLFHKQVDQLATTAGLWWSMLCIE